MTWWVSSTSWCDHITAGLDPPGRSELVRRALSGIRRIRATPPSRRAPLLLADIRGLVNWLSLVAGGWPAPRQSQTRRVRELALAGQIDHVYRYSLILTNRDVSTPSRMVAVER